ncbi:hypothetical protein ACRAWG_33775 [Methylobacterium sp. P31]
MTLRLDAKMALGNRAAQPDYATVERRDFIKGACRELGTGAGRDDDA